MLFQSLFTNKHFDDLQPGDFFFHMLSGEYSPAIKVVRANGEGAVIDLNMEQQNGRRLPSMTQSEGFETIALVAVPTAIMRPKPGLQTLKSSSSQSLERSALVMLSDKTLLRVRANNMNILVFNIATGVQTTIPQAAQCLWTTEWQIVIVENDKEQILFEPTSSA